MTNFMRKKNLIKKCAGMLCKSEKNNIIIRINFYFSANYFYRAILFICYTYPSRIELLRHFKYFEIKIDVTD